VGSVREFISFREARDRFESRDSKEQELCLAQVCQLRRLYHLFGYDPVSWKEAVAVEEVDEGTDTLSVQLVTPIQLMDWTCDYPCHDFHLFTHFSSKFEAPKHSFKS